MAGGDLAGSAFRCTLQVRWADFDQLGHVNNVKFVEYAQEARVMFFRARLSGLGLGPFPTVVRRTEIDHFRPILRGTTSIECEIGVESTGTTSFTLLHTLRDPDGDVCCEIRAVMVAVDPSSHEPTALSYTAKEALTAAPTAVELGGPRDGVAAAGEDPIR